MSRHPADKKLILDHLEARVRAALRAALGEAKKDPDFVIRVVRAVAEELGLDPVVIGYLLATLDKGGNRE
jgi:hypothetical protein